MSSRIRDALTGTAVWRLALGPTLVFAAGTTMAFVVMYLITASSIREHNDAWLSGEVEVLRQVSLAIPHDQLYLHVVRAVAESAALEVTGASRTPSERAEMIFFLHTDPAGRELIWLGPSPKARFINRLLDAQLPVGVPASVRIPAQRLPFRVVRDRGVNGTDIYLGLSDIHAVRLRNTLLRRLAWIWLGVVCAGALMSLVVARRLLARVESITSAAARIRSDDLSSRVPEGPHADEITRLARTLNGMLDRVAGSVTELRSLTDAVAHELKSPLTAVRGRLEIALSSDSDANCREAAGRAIEDLDRLSAFVTTTLDVAEADNGGLRVQRGAVNFSELVAQLVQLYEPAFTDRGQKITTDLPPRAMAWLDTTLIRRVLANLLENELRYAPPGARVTLTMTIGAGMVGLRIEDNGAGFPAELSGRLFTRFGKGGASRGHGLGLAFVRAIVLAHGGEVAAGNRVEGGAFVQITLPAANPAGA